MSESNIPLLEAEQISLVLGESYGLSGELSELPSYSDLNFKLTVKDGKRYIVKVANSATPFSSIDMQNAAMMHLADSYLPVPKVIKNIESDGITSIKDKNGNLCFLRVLSYLPGTFYADSSSDNHQQELWQDLGGFVGQLDRRLANFSHPGAHRYFEWDLTQGFAICQSKKYLLDDEQSALVDEFLNGYQTEVMPLLRKLPQGIIHNDANDYNLLVDDANKPAKIIGLIDFGDMVYSHLINELAITCAYAILHQQEPLAVVKQITIGYHQQRSLDAVEIKVVMHLIALRLCVTLCNAAQAIKEQPDNDYLLVSVMPAFKALKTLKAINFYAAELQLLDSCNLTEPESRTNQQIEAFRKEHLGPTLSLSYQQPLKIVSGKGAYLFDQKGRAYLDMVNNVCHVGHCHPKVVAAGQKQMARLNTNTRYLHDNIVEFSEKLLTTFPPELSVCMFVNSGSEANELAFRLAQCYTRSQQLIVVDGAYHGNTAACINASPYKFDGAGGQGAQSHIHKVVLPDPYRGEHSGSSTETGQAYAKDIDRVINKIQQDGNSVGAFICESLQGVAGQIIMPDGYLKAVYEKIRHAGGVCIADEVQVGFGRVGSHMWAFETQQVVPDIVTLGKPIGNGHPLAAVVMKKEIADAFANGMEFFNTFGGNPVSCAIGSAVLEVIQTEKLRENALNTGQYMRQKLTQLQQEFELIGDVRGLGLFIGVELVEDRISKKPATDKMSWLIEFFKQNAILLTSEGPFYNILKIKPPIVFSRQNADTFIRVFRNGLVELNKSWN